MGPASQRRETRRRRVSSPSAAKSGAASGRAASAAELRCLGKVLLDELHLSRPAALVLRERLRAARERNAIEARLGHGEQDAVRGVFELEAHERRRVFGLGLRGSWVPAEREEALGLDALDIELEGHSFERLLLLRDLRIDRGG